MKASFSFSRRVFIAAVCWYGLAAPLGDEAALADVSFSITYIDDAQGTFASRGWLDSNSLFQRNIRAALAEYGEQIDADTNFFITVDTVSYSARAGGQFSFGRFLRNDGSGHQIWEHGPLTRILTGDNPGENFYGFDIRLGFDANFVQNFYWLDPEPETRAAPVPANRGDFVSVVMHELGHGFGVAGNRSLTDGPAYGQFPGTTISIWDSLTYFGGNGAPLDTAGDPNPMFFAGPSAADIYGGHVPISNVPLSDPHYGGNFYHLGTCADSPILTGALMNNCTIPNGERLAITPIDRALLTDLGYPLLPEFLPGDYNANGTVDAADYTVWRNTLRSKTDLRADGTGPGGVPDQVVNHLDYDFWKQQYSDSPGSATAIGQFDSIPEPGSLTTALLAAITLCCLATRYRRRSRAPRFGLP